MEKYPYKKVWLFYEIISGLLEGWKDRNRTTEFSATKVYAFKESQLNGGLYQQYCYCKKATSELKRAKTTHFNHSVYCIN